MDIDNYLDDCVNGFEFLGDTLLMILLFPLFLIGKIIRKWR